MMRKRTPLEENRPAKISTSVVLADSLLLFINFGFPATPGCVSPFRILRNGLSILFLLLIMRAPAVTAQEDFSLKILDISSNTRGTVRLVISVLDERGTPVRGLNRSNFTPSVEGMTVSDFSVETVSSAKNPLSVVLALDISGSMHGTPIDEAKKAASVFLEQLAEQDYAALFSFGSSVRLLTEFTSNKAAVKGSLETLTANDMKTWLYSGTFECLQKAAAAPTSRVAIVLLTDGKDEGSPRAEEDVLGRIKGVRVPIFALGFGPNAQTAYLKEIAAASGGSFLLAPAVEELGRMYSQVNDQLKNQYQIEFRFEKPAGEYVAALALGYRGIERSARAPFLHALAGVPSAFWKRWFDNWFAPVILGLLVVLVAVSLVIVFRHLRPEAARLGSAEAPVEIMIDGKRRSISVPTSDPANKMTVVAQGPYGDTGLIVDLPPVPAYLPLLDEPNGRKYDEVIITRFDKDSAFSKEKIYLLISDRSVSRPDSLKNGHAAVFLDQNSGRYQIKDLGSIGGTCLNNAQLHEAAYLENGDAITIGTVSLKYYDTRSVRKTGAGAPSLR